MFSFRKKQDPTPKPEVGERGRLIAAASEYFGEDTEAAAAAVCPRTAELVSFLDPKQPRSRDLTPMA